jgi:hypothetical protein
MSEITIMLTLKLQLHFGWFFGLPSQKFLGFKGFSQ